MQYFKEFLLTLVLPQGGFQISFTFITIWIVHCLKHLRICSNPFRNLGLFWFWHHWPRTWYHLLFLKQRHHMVEPKPFYSLIICTCEGKTPCLPIWFLWCKQLFTSRDQFFKFLADGGFDWTPLFFIIIKYNMSNDPLHLAQKGQVQQAQVESIFEKSLCISFLGTMTLQKSMSQPQELQKDVTSGKKKQGTCTHTIHL